MLEIASALGLRRPRRILWIIAVLAAVPACAAMIAASSEITLHDLPAEISSAAFAAAVLLGDRWPVSSAAASGGAYIVAVQVGSLDPNASNLATNLATVGGMVAVFVLGVDLGVAPRWWTSLIGVAVLVIAVQWTRNEPFNFNPFPVMLIGGPWLVGRILRSRRLLADALQARGADLDTERERYALEAVRYERTRIASELHDIIGHCLSVVVIQAASGSRLCDSDPDGAAAVLDTIADLIQQAEHDLGALTMLLSVEDLVRPLSVEVIDQLIDHTVVTGTPVSVTIIGELDGIPPAVSAMLHRVLQEALTNALKHAPGAAISIVLATDDEHASADISNGCGTTQPRLVLEHGGGHGVPGLTAAVTALGGRLDAGATSAGGWQLTAVIPSLSGRVAAPVGD